MKKCTSVLAVLLTYSGIFFAQSESAIRNRIVGTWKLVSTELTMKDGTTRPYPQYGKNGKGFLMYARDGYMCADLVNPERPKWADHNQPTTDEKVAAGEGSFAYCGRYEIDVKHERIIHLPEVAADPGYVGPTGPERCRNRKTRSSSLEDCVAEGALGPGEHNCERFRLPLHVLGEVQIPLDHAFNDRFFRIDEKCPDQGSGDQDARGNKEWSDPEPSLNQCPKNNW
jgi:Lipocalin-like domain